MKKTYIQTGIFILIALSLLAIAFVYYNINVNKNILVLKDKQYYLTGNTLNINGIGVIDEDVKIIKQKIEDNKNVEIIYLGGNKISKEGLEYLSLLKNDTLKVIDLSNNNSGDAGMDSFIQKNSFKTIDVSGNNLTDIVLKDFGQNKVTKYLSINRNQITDIGFKDIFKNKNIEYLSIENNLLTDNSIDYLLNDYKGTHLKYLRLKGNPFSSGSIKKLDELKSKSIFDTLSY